MRRFLADNAWVLLPLAVLSALAAPALGYGLPGYESLLGENYQPLRALKFYSSLGGAYHKYGTLPNLLLLPVYLPAFAWWKLTGQFSSPSGDFPYGLADPLSQLSWLIFSGRLAFMLLGLVLYATLLRALELVTPRRFVIAAAFLCCIGTNWAAAHFLANTRPDGPTYAFTAASLGVYLAIVYRGASVRRGVLLSMCAVAAISSKEIAGPLYVLPYLGLGVWLYPGRDADAGARRDFWRLAAWTVAAGVGTYLLLNVVYAPLVWWTRIGHWLGGAGTSADVWIAGGSENFGLGDRVQILAEGFLNTLGPGGVWIALAGGVSLLWIRPRHWQLLSLPFLSILLLGLGPLGFSGDRFYTVGAIALVPPLAAGLAALAERLPGRGAAAGAAGAAMLLLTLNAVYGTWAWHRLDHEPMRVIEDSLAREGGFAGTLNVLAVHPRVPGKSRLEDQGYRVDPRSMQELLEADPASRPDRIYVNAGQIGFLEDGRELPERTELFRQQGLDLERWPGVEGLGYRLRERIVTRTPGWYPFDWMPSIRWTAERSPMYVYERRLGGGAGNPDPRTDPRTD